MDHKKSFKKIRIFEIKSLYLSKFNLKVLEAGEYSIEVRDYFKNLTSKSILNAQSGDNVFKFYTRALQDGDYTITVSKDGEQIYNVKLVIK